MRRGVYILTIYPLLYAVFVMQMGEIDGRRRVPSPLGHIRYVERRYFWSADAWMVSWMQNQRAQLMVGPEVVTGHGKGRMEGSTG